MILFERYTESARRTIFYARWWALNRKAARIETCDIVLGAAQETRKEDSPFRWMNLDYPRIVTVFADGVVLVEKPEEKNLPLSDSSKRALAYAVEEAKLDRRYSIDVHHLLRGVLRTDDRFAKNFAETGYPLEALREASKNANKDIPDARIQRRLKTSLGLLSWKMFSIREYLVLGFAFLAFLATVLYLHFQN